MAADHTPTMLAPAGTPIPGRCDVDWLDEARAEMQRDLQQMVEKHPSKLEFRDGALRVKRN